MKPTRDASWKWTDKLGYVHKGLLRGRHAIYCHGVCGEKEELVVF